MMTYLNFLPAALRYESASLFFDPTTAITMCVDLQKSAANVHHRSNGKSQLTVLN